MLWLYVTSAVVVLAIFVAIAIWQRQVHRSERPLSLWGQDYPGAEAVVMALEGTTGLSRVRRAEGLGWLTNAALSPVWFFWGDLRSLRPEQQLKRWRLAGTRSDGRASAIELDPDQAIVRVACRSAAAFWAQEGLHPEQQEGLRLFQPIGSERWQRGTDALRQVFTAGMSRPRLVDGWIVGEVTIDALSPLAAMRLLAALTTLAAAIET